MMLRGVHRREPLNERLALLKKMVLPKARCRCRARVHEPRKSLLLDRLGQHRKSSIESAGVANRLREPGDHR